MVLDKDPGIIGPGIPLQVGRFGQSAAHPNLIKKPLRSTRSPPITAS